MSVPPATGGSSPILQVRDLAVTYGGVVQALRGVDLEVDEGDVVAVLGSNGAGKTTLLRALSGTLRLHRGRVDEGDDHVPRRRTSPAATRLAASACGLVQVPEGRRIFTRLTVEENLRAGGLGSRDRAAKASPTTAGLRPVPGAGRAAVPARRACSPVASSRCWRSAAG